jgi:CBS domain-containing protein
MKCPSCGFDNLAGEETCDKCMHALMTRDLPQPKKGEKIQQVMMTAPISELLTGKDLLVAKGSDSIKKVIQILKKEKKDCVLVFSKRKLVGILSQRDILRRVLPKYKDLARVTVDKVMTANPEVVRAEDPIAFAVNKMSVGGFRHIPVLAADGTPLSIITIRDVLQYLDKRD